MCVADASVAEREASWMVGISITGWSFGVYTTDSKQTGWRPADRGKSNNCSVWKVDCVAR